MFWSVVSDIHYVYRLMFPFWKVKIRNYWVKCHELYTTLNVKLKVLVFLSENIQPVYMITEQWTDFNTTKISRMEKLLYSIYIMYITYIHMCVFVCMYVCIVHIWSICILFSNKSFLQKQTAVKNLIKLILREKK